MNLIRKNLIRGLGMAAILLGLGIINLCLTKTFTVLSAAPFICAVYFIAMGVYHLKKLHSTTTKEYFTVLRGVDRVSSFPPKAFYRFEGYGDDAGADFIVVGYPKVIDNKGNPPVISHYYKLVYVVAPGEDIGEEPDLLVKVNGMVSDQKKKEVEEA